MQHETALIRRLLPSCNTSKKDRVSAWNDWQQGPDAEKVLRFIRYKNHTMEPDEDILQDTLTTAFLEVERGRYTPREGIPFTAYVKGIARNKIREARRRHHRQPTVALDDVAFALADTPTHQPEVAFEQAQRRHRFYTDLADLPASRQQVIHRIIRGEPTAEIADAMEISEDQVRQHKSRALRSLRQQASGK
jgi:RNA polymerase sigma-70 factor (ECF subfamily)